MFLKSMDLKGRVTKRENKKSEGRVQNVLRCRTQGEEKELVKSPEKEPGGRKKHTRQ